MVYDENYHYDLIDDYTFNEKYLFMKNDGSKYDKYLLVYYKDNDEIKSMELMDTSMLKKIENVLFYYEVEKITSSCIDYDSGYDFKEYYNIDDKIFFTKYQLNKHYNFLVDDNNEEIQEIFTKLMKNTI